MFFGFVGFRPRSFHSWHFDHMGIHPKRHLPPPPHPGWVWGWVNAFTPRGFDHRAIHPKGFDPMEEPWFQEYWPQGHWSHGSMIPRSIHWFNPGARFYPRMNRPMMKRHSDQCPYRDQCAPCSQCPVGSINAPGDQYITDQLMPLGKNAPWGVRSMPRRFNDPGINGPRAMG